MPNVCFVKTCPNRKTKNVGKGVRFFTLPEREPERSEWLRRTGQENDGENLPRKPRFCAEHFDSSAFTNGDPTSARLRWSALPKLPKTLEPPQKRPRVQVSFVWFSDYFASIALYRTAANHIEFYVLISVWRSFESFSHM